MDNTACRERKTVKKMNSWFTETACLEWCYRGIEEKMKEEWKRWHVNILKVVPPCCFLITESKGNKKKKNTVSRSALSSAVDSRNFSDTLVWLNISEKYKRNFPENPKNTRKSQNPNLSVCQEIIETKKYRKLGGVNDYMRNPTSRRSDGRKKRGRHEGKPLFLFRCWIFVFFIKLTGPMLRVDICV